MHSINPFKFRPSHMDDIDWDDNWLSNSLAFFSMLIAPNLCEKPGTWAVRLTEWMWTSCSCCLYFRGIFTGLFLWFVVATGRWLLSL